MPLVSDNWATILLPGLRKVFESKFREQTSNLPALFSMKTSEKAQEFDLQTDEFNDFAQFQGTIPYDDMGEGYKTTYTHSEYARGFKVERKLVKDDLYGTINRKPSLLSLSARRRRERDGAAVFNNAFNSSFVGGDGVSLANTAHPSKNGGSNQSNTGTLAFSPANVEATRRLMIQFKTGRDGIMDVHPDLLLVPLELEEKGYELINSKGKVDTASNNVNFHQGKYKMLVWPNYLTSSKNWFFIDSSYMKEFLMWFDREPVQFFKDQDFGTLVGAYAGYMRYVAGFSDWRWIYAQQPA